jgi:hypothetical protein
MLDNLVEPQAPSRERALTLTAHICLALPLTYIVRLDGSQSICAWPVVLNLLRWQRLDIIGFVVLPLFKWQS